MEKTVKVIQPEKEVPVEVLADAIVSISQGIKFLRSSRLNEDALLLLIQHAAPNLSKRPPRQIGKREIKAVLQGIEALERTYLKRKP